MTLATVVGVVAIAVLLARSRSPVLEERRLARVLAAHRPHARRDRLHVDPGRVNVDEPIGVPSTAVPVRVRLVAALGVGVLAVVLVDGVVGVVAAAVSSAAAYAVIGRLEPAAARRRAAAARAELPYAVDLLAVCLAAGAPLDRALHVVGDSTGGVVGGALGRSAAMLTLGAPMADAVRPWRRDAALAELDRLAVLLVRSAESGTALAVACARLAADERDARRWRVDVVARKVAVRTTAPLGLCFLPAFVLLAIVPVVVAGAATVEL